MNKKKLVDVKGVVGMENPQSFLERQIRCNKPSLELLLSDVEEEIGSLHKLHCALPPHGRRALKFYERLAATLRKEIALGAKLPTAGHSTIRAYSQHSDPCCGCEHAAKLHDINVCPTCSRKATDHWRPAK